LPDLIWLPLAFFLIALFYSSVGFGGGSSYLAVLSLVLADFSSIRTVALLCNVVVVTGNCFIYWRAGSLTITKALPFVLISVPAAFIGGTLPLTETAFFLTLGAVLISSALLLARQAERGPTASATRPAYLTSFALGGGIGLLSGMVGIGGGIFLSPLLHLLRWDTATRIAALASFFILVNSLAGLAGLAVGGSLSVGGWLPGALLVAVAAGGQLGSRLGLNILGPRYVRLATAGLVFFAGLRLLLHHGFAV
jgi:uncharacterized membrane protein YfcA